MSGRGPEVAEVDYVVDEQGNPIELQKDTPLTVATALDESIGGTGPTNWWRYGLVAMAAIILALLLIQWLSGNPQTAVYPGTPVTAPQVETAK